MNFVERGDQPSLSRPIRVVPLVTLLLGESHHDLLEHLAHADGIAPPTDSLTDPLISRAAAPGPIDLMQPGDQFLRNAARRLDVDPGGLLDVVAHGSPTAVEVQGQVVTHRVLATLIERNQQFVGEDVRLLSCSTGEQASGFAQNLANRLGVQVTAPTDTLWAFPNGSFSIGPTPVANTGKWITFKPGGGR